MKTPAARSCGLVLAVVCFTTGCAAAPERQPWWAFWRSKDLTKATAKIESTSPESAEQNGSAAQELGEDRAQSYVQPVGYVAPPGGNADGVQPAGGASGASLWPYYGQGGPQPTTQRAAASGKCAFG